MASKKNKPSARFWTVLAAINTLILIYPLWLCLGNADEAWFAVMLLLCAVFLLLITDIVSILVTLSLYEY